MAIRGFNLVILVAAYLPQVFPQGGVQLTLQKVQATQVFEYRGYKDVQIFHYKIPEQTTVANWNMTARERQVRHCEHRNVSLYLKHGSYPVVSPDGSLFPPDVRPDSEEQHVQLLSDGVSVSLSIQVPQPGDWFAIAFVQPDDSDRIKQKGLSPYCSTWIESFLSIEWTNNTILVTPEVQNYQDIQLYQAIESLQQITYRFYVPANTRQVLLNLTRCWSTPEEGRQHCPLQVLTRPRALPQLQAPFTKVSNCTEANDGTCQLDFIPWEEEWHYVTILASEFSASFFLKVSFLMCDSEFPTSRYYLVSDLETQNICSSLNKSSKLRIYFRGLRQPAKEAPSELCWDTVALTRNTFPGSFMFEYDLFPDENGTTPLKLDLSTNNTSIMSFVINPVMDIGGALNLEIGLDPTVNMSGSPNMSIVACLSLKTRYEPTWGSCGGAEQAMLQVNSSGAPGGSAASMARMLIPFPAPGMWHLTLKPFCYIGNNYNDSVEVVECTNSSTSLFFSITSSSCLPGGCGAFGRCYQYISGGFLFSTCVCNAGYRGWGCTDDAEAIPGSELLMATLLLTLSNILFVPAIAIAAYRRYFTEALVYACTMLFSALYHACDEEAFSLCLLRLNVLQFCDFYSAILAFWVTLLAMAHLPAPLTSLLHMAGAIGVALGIEYDRTGLAVFMVPTISGTVILAASWLAHCRERHSCFPSKKYWLIYLPPGLILAAGGLICYAFFETEQNYKFVHSVWHATMALSIVFFLPFRKVQAVKAKLSWRGLQR